MRTRRPFPPTAVLILAAGAGRRMGIPKALLAFEGRPLVERLVLAARRAGHEAVICVVGAEGPRAGALAAAAGATVVPNPHWERGQTSSLREGLSVLPSWATAFLIHPVDHAGAGPADFEALRAALAREPDPTRAILRPVHRGREFGHPVLFGRAFLPEFLALDDSTPARTVYRRHLDAVVPVAVTNPRIALDLDDPGDLGRA